MKKTIYNYLELHPPALELFHLLEHTGEIYLIGGVLREFLDHAAINELRDVDIIINIKDRALWSTILDEYRLRSNRFGGHKLVCEGLLIDTWPIEQTWAFREKIVQCSPDQYVSMLPETVFLNIDGIIYDWKQEKWYDSKYKQAIATKTLDVVLARNPQILLNIVRSFVLKQRYNMTLSYALQKIIYEECKKFSTIDLFVEALMSEQTRRYGKVAFSKDNLLLELNRII